MLILSRREGETVVVANGLVVFKIIDVLQGRVRIGVDAPKDMPVHRGEVQERIDAQRNARETNPPPDAPTDSRVAREGRDV